jgi:hypothetical protein
MRSAGNFSPEWGYLAATPSFARTARVVLVATAIGATAGAGVVLTLADRPAESQKTSIAARAIVTSVRVAMPSDATTTAAAAVSPNAIAAAPAGISVSTRMATGSVPPAQSQADNKPLAASSSAPAPSTAASSTAASSTAAAMAAPGLTNPAPPATTGASARPVTGPVPTPSANSSTGTASSSAANAGSANAPAVADAAAAELPDSSGNIAPEPPPQKKAKARHAASKSPVPGIGSLLRRLFVAHAGRSYYPN